MLNVEQWRLGHRRPWWQWNVITLFVLLFALVWARELFDWSGIWTWIFCAMVLMAWLVVPACVGLQRDFMLSHRKSEDAVLGANEATVYETPATRRRALVVISIVIFWIAIQLLALLQ